MHVLLARATGVVGRRIGWIPAYPSWRDGVAAPTASLIAEEGHR